MIGRITGILSAKQPPQILVEVNGIGYEIDVPMSTFYNLPALGEKVSLLTHQAIREDAHLLFGFGSEIERAAFRELLKVSGIGAKTALSVLSGLSVNDLSVAIAGQEIGRIVKVPGIGKKTAERIVVELRDRLDGVDVSGGTSLRVAGAPLDASGEATVALQQLGYKPAEVSRLVQKVAAEGDNAEAIIRKALRAALGN